MSAMTTTLELFQSGLNTVTYKRSGHTPALPKLVLQKRKVPSGSAVMAEDTITVLNGTVDVDDKPIPQRVTFAAVVRRPISGDTDDVTSALAVFRDIVASDEFGAMVTGQSWVK